jgi:hypothetical protein
LVARALARELLDVAATGDIRAMTALLDAGVDANAMVNGGGPLIAAGGHGPSRSRRIAPRPGADINLAAGRDPRA